jgi:hypothetical protein
MSAFLVCLLGNRKVWAPRCMNSGCFPVPPNGPSNPIAFNRAINSLRVVWAGRGLTLPVGS